APPERAPARAEPVAVRGPLTHAIGGLPRVRARYCRGMSTSQTEPRVAEPGKQVSPQTSRAAPQGGEVAESPAPAERQEPGGGAGLFGLYALGALTAAAILALATAIDGWLAALIVAAVYGVIAGVLALQGKNKVQAATPPVPEQATESVKEDVRWAKIRAQA